MLGCCERRRRCRGNGEFIGSARPESPLRGGLLVASAARKQKRESAERKRNGRKEREREESEFTVIVKLWESLVINAAIKYLLMANH